MDVTNRIYSDSLLNPNSHDYNMMFGQVSSAVSDIPCRRLTGNTSGRGSGSTSGRGSVKCILYSQNDFNISSVGLITGSCYQPVIVKQTP